MTCCSIPHLSSSLPSIQSRCKLHLKAAGIHCLLSLHRNSSTPHTVTAKIQSTPVGYRKAYLSFLKLHNHQAIDWWPQHLQLEFNTKTESISIGRSVPLHYINSLFKLNNRHRPGQQSHNTM